MRILLFSLLLALAYVTYERITSYAITPEPEVETFTDPYKDHPMHCMCYAHR